MIRYTYYLNIELTLGVVFKSENEKQSSLKTEKKTESLAEVVVMGEIMTDILQRMPLSLTVNLENVEAVALLDRGAK